MDADDVLRMAEEARQAPPPPGWPCSKEARPLACPPEIALARTPDGTAVILGLFTDAGALFCAMMPDHARQLGQALTEAAAKATLVVPGLVVP